MQDLVAALLAVLLVSLRVGPMLAFAPPFTLLAVPPTIRVLVALGIALCLVAGRPDETTAQVAAGQSLVVLAAGELVIGMAIALAMQLAFAALQWAGGVVDVQAGFGFAMVADPATQAQVPLTGTVLSYAAGALFFLGTGMADLLALWALSLDQVPLGSAAIGIAPTALAALLGGTFMLAVGVVGLLVLVMFLLDLAIGFMSRTLPQMNVLLLGFQVKAMATLLVLPLALALSGAVILRLMRLALENAPRLLLVAGG